MQSMLLNDVEPDAIVNRDEPMPVLRIPLGETKSSEANSEEHDDRPGARDVVSDKVYRFRDMWEGVSAGGASKQAVYDRIFARIMAQVIPAEEMQNDGGETIAKKDRRSQQYVERPNFSLPQMSSNFRRFNARIGVVFVGQNRLIYLFSWRQPMATLSFLAVYTLLTLNPGLLPLLPLTVILFFIMVPAFTARHPTPTNDPRIEPSLHGPPIAPARHVKPAPEMSRDFFRNMRDLQNSMEDFSVLHDSVVDQVAVYLNFSDEKTSSALFAVLILVCCIVFFTGHLIPWRLVILLNGWGLVLAGHPVVQSAISQSVSLKSLGKQVRQTSTQIRDWVETEMLLDGPPESRQVEVFELQKHHVESDTWEPWLFSPSAYDPLCPARISGARPEGTQFFEEVQPPSGWAWEDKKWTLDMFSREWVEQRMISGVEIEMDGERWVYDIPAKEIDLLEHASKGKHAKKKSKPDSKPIPQSGWEEATGTEGRGEWRRRRWIRVVQRKVTVSSSKSIQQ